MIRRERSAQCTAITRAGRRCSVSSDCKLMDRTGRLAAETLRRGSPHCLFHTVLFCSRPTLYLEGGAQLVYLDFETTGLEA